MNEIIALLTRYRVVPVIAIEDIQAALPLADALLEGGLPLAEITFRTQAAAEVIRTLRRERPMLHVGAGTVLTRQNMQDAIEAGAVFGVAPGFDAETLALAEQAHWPFIPGVCTPSEVQLALSRGCRILKFFPAGAMGGPDMLQALAAPYLHTGVRFMPTGGVNESTLPDYLRNPVVAACGGTWIATQRDIAVGNWSLVKERCRRITEIVAQ